VSTFLANSNLKDVSEGMMRAVEVLDNRPKHEKQAIVACLFNCLYNSKLKEIYGIADVMDIVENMRFEAKRTKVPEFGGAERFVKGEL
jgi:hypothetical protein